ncbi:hypothetical protein [Tautonia rosea]|uniref:hypothetical protein n=1 Tax=Tautonia rosea TaxID=2728037 RepID=UPI00147578BA|nr:hypothetical protein [Tautonia rosea]
MSGTPACQPAACSRAPLPLRSLAGRPQAAPSRPLVLRIQGGAPPGSVKDALTAGGAVSPQPSAPLAIRVLTIACQGLVQAGAPRAARP